MRGWFIFRGCLFCVQNVCLFDFEKNEKKNEKNFLIGFENNNNNNNKKTLMKLQHTQREGEFDSLQ